MEKLLSCYHSQEENATENYREILQCLVSGLDKNPMGSNFNYYSRAHVILKICEPYIEVFPDGMKNSIFANGLDNNQTRNIINKLSYQFFQ